MVLVQNEYKNTQSSPSCYVTLRTQVIRLNSGNLGPQKTDSGVFTIVTYCNTFYTACYVTTKKIICAIR